MTSTRSARLLLTCGTGLLAVFACHHVQAAPSWDGVQDRDLSGWEVHLSPYTYHLSQDPKHTDVYLAGLAKVNERGWLAGGAVFQNSFGQPCVYFFGGRKYVEPWGWERIYWSWTAGILYGYKPPYENKVPFNSNGFSPAIIPTLGYQFTPTVSGEIAMLGTAGIMFNIAFQFK
jgi:hypothetical protein